MIRLDDAACRHLDPALFHPAPHDNRTLKAARDVCAGCPIRLDCLALALTIPDAQGIWGGLTQSERADHRTHQPPQFVPAA